MNAELRTAAIVGVIALMTWITRALPYLLFSRKGPPRLVAYLGGVLPASIMVILVVYCLRNTAWTLPPQAAQTSPNRRHSLIITRSPTANGESPSTAATVPIFSYPGTHG